MVVLLKDVVTAPRPIHEVHKLPQGLPEANYSRAKPKRLRKTPARNIVLCFDGTSNTFQSDLSSLPTLYSFLNADPDRQLCYYQQGIGTSESTWIGKLVDQGIALNLPEHIKAGYRYLVDHYQGGDRIYLFGFSRGAYTARALAGMLQQCGLVLPGNEESIALAYKIYSGGAAEELAPGTKLAAAFQATFSIKVSVHFIGVWDTVSSVGALIPGKALPFSAGSSAVTHFRHAMSLDERRVRFSPQPWMPDVKSSQAQANSAVRTTVKEVHFAGVHSNVGGGYLPTTMDVVPSLSHVSLRWMLREACEQGLLLDLNAVISSPIFKPFIDDAMHKSQDPLLEKFVQGPVQEYGINDADSRFVLALTYEASLPSEEARRAALAPRGDALSFKISKAAHGARGSTFWGRFSQRAMTCVWWLMEVTPTLRVVWDVEGETRSWKWRLNLGRGRHLPPNPVLHHSVRERLQAKPEDFGPGDGYSIPETRYKIEGHFAKGESLATAQWDDGGVYEA